MTLGHLVQVLADLLEQVPEYGDRHIFKTEGIGADIGHGPECVFFGVRLQQDPSEPAEPYITILDGNLPYDVIEGHRLRVREQAQ